MLITYCLYGFKNEYCDFNNSHIRYDIKFKNLEKKYYENNSSIIKNGESYYVYTRISNYSDITYPIIRAFYWLYCDVLKVDKYHNLLGVTQYDNNFDIISQNIYHPNIKNKNLSIEDLRAFKMYKNIYFIGIAKNNIEKKCYPVILDQYYNIYDIVNSKNGSLYYGDKNLVLIGENTGLIIKTHNPLDILIIKSKTDHILVDTYFQGKYDKNIPNFRGSTNYLSLEKNKYIGIAHCVDSRLIYKNYTHYFIILVVRDDGYVYIDKVSVPICFTGNCGVEFIMGLEETFDKDNYIITLGKNDSSSHMIVVNKNIVLSYVT